MKEALLQNRRPEVSGRKEEIGRLVPLIASSYRDLHNPMIVEFSELDKMKAAYSNLPLNPLMRERSKWPESTQFGEQLTKIKSSLEIARGIRFHYKSINSPRRIDPFLKLSQKRAKTMQEKERISELLKPRKLIDPSSSNFTAVEDHITREFLADLAVSRLNAVDIDPPFESFINGFYVGAFSRYADILGLESNHIANELRLKSLKGSSENNDPNVKGLKLESVIAVMLDGSVSLVSKQGDQTQRKVA